MVAKDIKPPVKCLTNKIRVLCVVILTALSLVAIAQKQVVDRGNGTCYLPDEISVTVESIHKYEPNLLNLTKHVLFYATTSERYLDHYLLPSSCSRCLTSLRDYRITCAQPIITKLFR